MPGGIPILLLGLVSIPIIGRPEALASIEGRWTGRILTHQVILTFRTTRTGVEGSLDSPGHTLGPVKLANLTWDGSALHFEVPVAQGQLITCDGRAQTLGTIQGVCQQGNASAPFVLKRQVITPISSINRPGVKVVAHPQACTDPQSTKTWLQANGRVLSSGSPPSPLPGVSMAFDLVYADGQTNTSVHADVATDADGRATIDVEVCGKVNLAVVSFVEMQAIIKPGSADIVPVVRLTTEPVIALRPAALTNIDPGIPGIEPGGIGGSPGRLVSFNPNDNPGTVGGKVYSSRFYLHTVVTPRPAAVVSVTASTSCRSFDMDNNPATLETVGDAKSYAVMWPASPTPDPAYHRSAVVLFEGIDGNNETWPAQWYVAMRALNFQLGDWNPQGSPPTWGQDLWVVNYAWGGADIKNCVIPAAKELLYKIGDYYDQIDLQAKGYWEPTPLALIGFSMGGVVARGAAAQLDIPVTTGNSPLIDLGVKALITIDAPHQGAEVHYKTCTIVNQIHACTGEPCSSGPGYSSNCSDLRTTSIDRSWLKAWNPAAGQLLYERCTAMPSIPCSKRDNAHQLAIAHSLADCSSISKALHDGFYSWLQAQGRPGSRGYPTGIPKYAASLAVSSWEVLAAGNYIHGNDVLWVFDLESWLNLLTEPDEVAETRYYTLLENDPDVQRGYRNRKPGSRYDLASALGIDPHMKVYYNPTFISLNSALDAGAINTFSFYGDSPFGRIWYPTERPASGLPLVSAGGHWYHDPNDVIANAAAQGVNDSVGTGQDFAYGFDIDPNWKRQNLVAFLSEGTNVLWKYAPLPPPPTGFQAGVTRETWNGVPGNNVSDLTNSTTFRGPPNTSGLLGVLKSTGIGGLNTGTRLRGYVIPRETGLHRFYLNARHSAELWLSDYRFERHKQLIASVTYPGVAEDVWDAQAGQQSQPIMLLGGESYYLEVLYKRGGDLQSPNVGVAWEGPGISATPSYSTTPPYIANPDIGHLIAADYNRETTPVPDAVTVQFADRSATASWIMEPGSTYDLMWRSEEGASGVVAPATAPSVITGLSNGVRHYFWVRPVPALAPCDPVSLPCPSPPTVAPLSPAGSGYPPDNTPPTPPGIVSVTPKQSGQLEITWTPDQSVDHYELSYRANSGTFSVLNDHATAPYLHTGLTNSELYGYRLRSYKSPYGWSPYSVEASQWVVGPVTGECDGIGYDYAVPCILEAAPGDGTIAVTWNFVHGARIGWDYTVYWREADKTAAPWKSQYGLYYTPFTITGLQKGTAYAVSVQAWTCDRTAQYCLGGGGTPEGSWGEWSHPVTVHLAP